ncbi:MAG: carboxypeptidase regulatory-like domain-containing protein [Planctomycetales bacterium]|nr:carboxypeptidase regulatory-like domain-containing protein [Planctomycetales bacterium]
MTIRSSTLGTPVLGLVLLALGCGGCGGKTSVPGGGPETSGGGSAEAPKAGAKVWDPALGTAGVRGTVKLAGKAPKRRPIDMNREPRCHEAHGGKALDESVIVNEDGTLRNAFVWVKKGLESWSFPMPSDPAVVTQTNCVYIPHVQGVRAGQTISIRNGDPCLHNIHAYAKRNTEFNFGQPGGSAEATRTFDRPEVMAMLKCDVHGWMSAYIGVVAHPYFAVTADGGRFELPKLPPGDYTVEAWHEVYGSQARDVRVGDRETREVEFQFEEK